MDIGIHRKSLNDCRVRYMYKSRLPHCHHRRRGAQNGANDMAITVNIRYTGTNGNAAKFVDEMISSGTVKAIREEAGNLRYEYYQSLDDPETILLIDSWQDQAAIDAHHSSPMMATIAELREKYDLHMTVERYIGAENNSSDENT